jgi:excisionase family DNA binding protein
MAEWLTLDELAAYLKRGRSTLYKMARQGSIPATKIGRTWRFEREVIDTWLREQTPSAPRVRKKKSRKNRKEAR